MVQYKMKISIKGIFTGHVRMRFFFVLLIFNLRVHGYEISRLSNSASRGKQWRYHPRTLHKKVVEGGP